MALYKSFDLHLTLWCAGRLLHNDDALISVFATEGLMLTAVPLVSRSHRAQMQPKSTAMGHVALSPAHHASASASVSNTVNFTNHDAADDGALLSLASAPESRDASAASPSKSAAQSSAAAAATVHNGSRVRIAGLQATPHMNGRTGVVCGALNEETGRWTVDVAADGAKPACRGSFLAANLRLIPSHNFSSEWVDECGRMWPKNVDFSQQCAKGHALAPLGESGGLAGVRLMCRLCHCFCERGCAEAASWLICSDDAGCCGEYAVCCSCARSPGAAAAACAGSDDFCTLVSCVVKRFVRGLTSGAAGRGSAVPVLAAVDVGRIAGPHDNVSVLPAVCAPVHVVQPRQRHGAAAGARRHCAARGRGDVVRQPHVEQRVCRHA
jgi:hypothetical protein